MSISVGDRVFSTGIKSYGLILQVNKKDQIVLISWNDIDHLKVEWLSFSLIRDGFIFVDQEYKK